MANTLDWQTITPATPIGTTAGYIDLPAFAYTGLTWKGSSEIASQYNYSASKNFVLRNLPVKPAGCNYVLCVRFRVGNVVTRLKLWDDANCVLNADLYSGQVLKKNFVLEIWTLNGSTTATQTAAIRVILSIQRVVTDFSIVPVNYAEAIGAEVTAASIAASLIVAPSLPAGFAYRYNVDTPPANPVATWADLSANARDFTQAVGASKPGLGNVTINGVSYFPVDFDGVNDFLTQTNSLAGPVTIYLVVNQVTWTLLSTLLSLNTTGLRLRQNDVTPKLALMNGSVTNLATATEAALGTFYIVTIVVSNTSAGISLQVNENPIYAGVYALAANTLTLGSNNGGGGNYARMQVLELIGYGSVHDAATQLLVNQFLQNKYYGGGTLPLVFGASNQWLDNV